MLNFLFIRFGYKLAMAAMQIEHETFIESFDERRINQLKAQLVQLERQVGRHTSFGYFFSRLF